MSKVRDLPQISILADDDMFYVVDSSEGPNGGRKITRLDLKSALSLTASEVKVLYESNPDTNAFTDAEKAKLATVEANAAFQNADEVPYDNSVSALSATNVQDALDEVNIHAQADFRPSIVSGRILHYTGGTARFDGVLFALVAGDILLNQSVTNGEVYVDTDGLVKQTGSGVLAPPYTIVFAKFSTDLNNIISLTDERVKNAQNIVRGILSDVRDIRAGAAAQEGNSGRVSDAMHKHNILTAAATTQFPDVANAEGTSVSLARADHTHEIPTDVAVGLSPASSNTQGSAMTFALSDHTHAIATALVGDITTILPDDAASAGIADTFARGDHKHAVATAAPSSTLSPASSNSEGSGDNFARADHDHVVATALVGDITTILPDDAASAGTANTFARGDHKHAIAAAAPTTTLSPATSNAEGAGTSFARNDHTHAVATALVGDITTILPDDAASAGTANTFARGDHRHAIAAAAPTTTLSPATSNAEGAGTSFARNDHTHAVATALVGVISTIQPDDAAAAGTSDTFARGDHKHAIVTDAPVNTGSANAEGNSTSFARANHVHNTTIANSTASATADDTTTSVTDTLMNSMTLTPAAGTYLVNWNGSILNSANGAERTWVSLYVAGSQATATERSVGTGGGAYVPASVTSILQVNGSQAIELRWRVAGGTSTVRSRRLSLIRLGD